MKLNKIITLSLSLVLAPALNAQTVTAVDTAKGLARAVAFHGSRFVAGRLFDKYMVIMTEKAMQKIEKVNSPKWRSVLHVVRCSAFDLPIFLSVAQGPQWMNKTTTNSKLSLLRFLAPHHTQSPTAGRSAMWAGVMSHRVFRELARYGINVPILGDPKD